MSSSVMARLLISVRERDKVQNVHYGNGFGLGDPQSPPDIYGIVAGAQALQPLLQARLLGFQYVLTEARRGADQWTAMLRKLSILSSVKASAPPISRRCLPPIVRHTRARSLESNSSTPR